MCDRANKNFLHSQPLLKIKQPPGSHHTHPPASTTQTQGVVQTAVPFLNLILCKADLSFMYVCMYMYLLTT